MVCSALIKDEKQQARAAPTNKHGAVWLWRHQSPKLIQIWGSRLPMLEGTNTENEILHTTGNPLSSAQPYHNTPSKHLLGEEWSFSNPSLMHTLKP